MDNILPIPGCKSMIIGEAPHWIEKDQALVFVDILGQFYRFFSETGRLQQMKLVNIGKGNTISVIIPILGAEDEFIITVGRTVAYIKWKKSDPDYCAIKPIPICTFDVVQNNRFNDGKCDPAGRLWTGTMSCEADPNTVPDRCGTLYRLDSTFSPSGQLSQIAISNGLAWSHDCTKMYYIDSMEHTVDTIDYDNDTGDLNKATRIPVFNYMATGRGGFLDGMCIDTDGHLWIACYGIAMVICVDPLEDKILREIEIPSLYVTSCCWGGKNYSTLYVTSANNGLPKQEFTKRPDTGKTFAITGLGAKGLPPVEYKVGTDELECMRNKHEANIANDTQEEAELVKLLMKS